MIVLLSFLASSAIYAVDLGTQNVRIALGVPGKPITIKMNDQGARLRIFWRSIRRLVPRSLRLPSGLLAPMLSNFFNRTDRAASAILLDVSRLRIRPTFHSARSYRRRLPSQFYFAK
jgi:hypothetical protein